jgi:TonB family protein
MKKALLVIAILALNFVRVFAQSGDSAHIRAHAADTDVVFTIVQQMPKFTGGDIYKYISNHLQYPQSAINSKTQGTVYVTFVVEKNGTLSGVKAIRSVSHALDSAAVACISSMPVWQPGMQNGHAVRVAYNIPIDFKLDNQQAPPPPAPTQIQQGPVTATKITVFRADAPQKTTAIDSLRGIDKGVIKWNWSYLTRGVFLLNYEFRLHGNFTVELGLGLAYRDFIFEALKAPGEIGFDYFTGQTSPGTNVCGEAGLRYYPRAFDNFEGVYIEGTLSYRSYTFPNSTDIAASGSSMVPGYNFFDTQFKFGYVAENWQSDIVYDFYCGFGLRSASMNYYTSNEVTTSSGNVQTVLSPSSKTDSYPQVLFGFKIAFIF